MNLSPMVRYREVPKDNKRGYVPAYEFTVRLPVIHTPVGRINLRIGNTEHVVKYGGHIGYGIEEKYRGHHYAAKACRLIKKVALDHGLDTLWPVIRRIIRHAARARCLAAISWR
jgi:predicted acetyltransferase